ncbi:MAG: hypothetical protein BWY93_02366 [Euryarchaeota archaeon ADurb.BinA087]|nr:MAG: hypothetical protein BWY93_02366 [Euryarchaeota archaeon ADurb.BinA087]
MIRYHIRRDESAIKLHPLYNIEAGFKAFCILDRDEPAIAHLLHGIRDELPNLFIIIGRYRRNLKNTLSALDRHTGRADVPNNVCNRRINAPLNLYRVGPRGNILQAFGKNSLRKKSCRCCPITGLVLGLLGNLFDQLCADILELVVKGDLFCYRHPIVCHDRVHGLVDHHIPPFRAKRDLDRVRYFIDT